MNVKQIFDASFLSTVQALLDEKCVAGGAVTRADLCKHLDLTAPDTGNAKMNKHHGLVLEGVVGSLITLAIISGFESRKGPGGGIGRIGEKRVASPKEKGAASTKDVTFPDGFLAQLETTLGTKCNTTACCRRKDIASAMGMAGSDTEALISAAIRDLSGLGAQYESQRGVNGGIRRRLVALSVQPTTTQPEPEVEASSDSDESEVIVDSSELPDEVPLNEHAALAFATSMLNTDPEPIVEVAPLVAEPANDQTVKPATKKSSKKSGGKKSNKKGNSNPAAA